MAKDFSLREQIETKPRRLYRIKKYEPMWWTNNEIRQHYKRPIYNFINISGRLGGKTTNVIQLIALTAINKPEFDIVVLRANSSQLKQSVFLELRKFLMQILPFETFIKIKFRNSPPLSITMPTENQIVFGGVGMGSKSGSNQSRGKTTERKISLLIIEETQEIFSGSSDGAELLKQAIATYMRYLDDNDGKVVYLGNRDRNVNGKFNVWVREKEKDETFLIIETNYHDIEVLLNDATLRMIQQEKEINPKNYEYMYLGTPVGGNDLVYGAFVESKHVINSFETKKIFSQGNLGNIFQLYIGVDGASTQDTCVFVPIFQFTNGKLVVRTKDLLYHRPRKNGQIMNSEMAKRHATSWLRRIIAEYQVMNKRITFVVDGANVDLIANLAHEFRPFPNVYVHQFTHKDLVETSDRVNNAFTEGLLYLTDESWYELLSNDEIHPSVLFNELQTVCWREDDPTKFNDAIPNDTTDGIRYPVAYHAITPYQLRDYQSTKVR